MDTFYTRQNEKEEKEKMSLKDKVDSLTPLLKAFERMDEKQKNKLIKNIKVPRKAKVKRSRMKKGWVGVLFANPNKVVKGEKTKLDGGTFKLKDGLIRYTDGHEIAWWEGKYPFIWQRYDKMNPTNLFPKEGDKNEMYGQDEIYLRFKKDLIKEKVKGGMSILMIIGILIGGYFVLKLVFPQLLGG